MGINLSIKNAPEDVVRRLKARAARNHRSLQGELLAIIEAAANSLRVEEVRERVHALDLATPEEAAGMLRADRSRQPAASVAVDAGLYAKSREAGIDAAAIVEEALSRALSERQSEQLRAEIREDLEAYNAYVAEHGSPADLVREHYGDDSDAV